MIESNLTEDRKQLLPFSERSLTESEDSMTPEQRISELEAEVKRLERVNQELTEALIKKERECTCQLTSCMD